MKLKLDIFEGPLDLLIYLIKKNHINIYDIPITSVVEQYLQYLDLMKMLDINIASEYLVMAATLINIKSKMLLPQPETETEPEQELDPRQELVNKLLEYERFKEAAQFLREKEAKRLKYIRRSSSGAESEEREVFFEASIFDLITAFKTALKDVPRDIFFEVIKDEFTVEEKIHFILHTLLVKEKIHLQELFSSAKNKLEIVVFFLAILELIRLKEIVALQEELFGEIIIMRQSLFSLSKEKISS